MATDLSLKIPVIEMYGPVLQGEGLLVGRPTWFLRLGGCDYLCKSCDSMHAVDPHLIEQNKEVMSATEIANNVCDSMGDIRLLTISGGNPALWDLEPLVVLMHARGNQLAVETQGTHWKPWLNRVDYLTVSPKGPSMIDDWEAGLSRFRMFLEHTVSSKGMCVKVPVFGESDLQFCEIVLRIMAPKFRDVPLYISIGNEFVPDPAPSGGPVPPLSSHRDYIFKDYERIASMVFRDHPLLLDCPILPQLHVLQYGNELRR